MIQTVIWNFVIFAVVASAWAQEPPRFRARTDLVFLNVTVTDRRGKPVESLTRPEFRVYEDKVEQQIQYFDMSSAPLCVGLLLDQSGSMSRMIDEVYEAALHIVENSSTEDQLFAMTFNREIFLVQGFTHSHRRIAEAIQDLQATGGTALYDAVFAGLRFANRCSALRKVLCVVSDGEDTVSRMGFKELLKLARESEVLIYPVGMIGDMPLINWGPFGSRYVKQLKQLAKVTGGRAHFPDDASECRRTMREIAEELHAQYGLGYYPSRPLSEGGWREVNVVLSGKHKKFQVRTRTGYQANPSRSAFARLESDEIGNRRD